MAWKNRILDRQGAEHSEEVTSVELFFDLIYVFAVTQLSHFLLNNLSFEGAIQTLVMWFAVWLGWQYNTWITNWFDPEKMHIRLMLFAVMLGGLVMAVSIPSAFGTSGLIFAASYVTIQLGRSLFILISLGQGHRLTDNYRRISVWLFISACLWIGGAFLEGYERMGLWAMAALCEYVAPMHGFKLPFLGRSRSEDWDINGAHMAERCQLFVIVALGESILITGATMAHHAHWDIPTIIAFLVAFIGSLAMWWIYFDTSSKDGSEAIRHAKNPGLVGAQFNYVHITLVAGIIVSAVANELVIAHPPKSMDITSISVIIGGPLIYLIGNAIYKNVVYRRIPKSHILAIAGLLALIPVSFVTDYLMIGGLTTLLLVLLAIFDGCNQRQPRLEV